MYKAVNEAIISVRQKVWPSICILISFFFFFTYQAPYIIYVEVLEVDNLDTASVQAKLTHSLRHTRSEENLVDSPASTSSSQLDLTTTPTTTATVTTSGLGSTSSIPSSLSSPHLNSGMLAWPHSF